MCVERWLRVVHCCHACVCVLVLMPLLTRWALLYDTTSDVDASVQWASTLVLPAVSLCYIASRRRAFWYLSSSLDTPRRCALSLAATHRLATAVRLVALLVLVACVNARVVVSYTHLLPVQGIFNFFSVNVKTMLSII